MTALRWAGAAGLLLLGASTAVAALVAHETWWGLWLSVAAVGATLVAIGPGWLTRLPYAVGFAAVVAWAVPTRPEGDYLVSSSSSGYTLLGVTLLLVAVAVATLPRPRRVPDAGPVGATTYHGARDFDGA